MTRQQKLYATAEKLVDILDQAMTRKGLSEEEKQARWDRFSESVRKIPDLPKAYGGCRCPCHRTGAKHVVACCSPKLKTKKGSRP